jgi:twitching motility protein PilT
MMQSGKKYGMQTMNDALYQLYMAREVTLDECLRVSHDPTEFQRLIGMPVEGDDPSKKQEPLKRPGLNNPVSGRR